MKFIDPSVMQVPASYIGTVAIAHYTEVPVPNPAPFLIHSQLPNFLVTPGEHEEFAFIAHLWLILFPHCTLYAEKDNDS